MSFPTTLKIVELLAGEDYDVETRPGRASLSISCYKGGNRVEMVMLCEKGKDAEAQKAEWDKAVQETAFKAKWDASMRKELGDE